MLKKTKTLFIILVLVISAFPLLTKAEIAVPILPEVTEQIDEFGVEATIHPDGKVTVVERIDYNFGAEERHGIFRFIPVMYSGSNGTKFSVRIKVKSVKDEQGASYKYTTKFVDNNIQIKVGDKDRLITGKKIYFITYELERVISYFPDHDEWYWNITGNGWDIPIQKAHISVNLPDGIVAAQSQGACYTGFEGSSAQECTSLIPSNSEVNSLTFASSRVLNAREGMTIVVGLPKGIIAKPSLIKKMTWFIKDNWPLTIPFIAAIILFSLWYTKGRDPKGRGTIIAEYEPPKDLSPIEVGTIYNEEVDKRDIASLFIDLAIRGFLKIKQVSSKWSEDYEFSKVKDDTGLTRSYEQKFFKELFVKKDQQKLSGLKTTFYKTTQEIKKDIYESLTKRKFFVKNPAVIRGIYTGIGISIAVLGVVFSGTNQATAFWNMAALVITGVLCIVFGWIMPARTREGVLALEHIKGFKLFLSVTEKDRLKFHNAPAKKPALFEKFLPYAMVLGVEKEWAKQFEGIYTKPPSWYEGNWSAFSVGYLAGSLSNFSSSAGSAVATSPSHSSGFSGGSSGGGFGGGGGGSW